MFIDEVAKRLRVTVRQILKLEARRRFPVPRLQKLDRHARYSRAVVEAFVEGQLLHRGWGKNL